MLLELFTITGGETEERELTLRRLVQGCSVKVKEQN